MDQTGRLYKIDQLLRQHKVISFAALQAALGISRATLKRDLDELRTRLKLCPSNGAVQQVATGWHRPGGPSTGTHGLPGLWFSSNEIHALLTMQQLLAGLDTGGLIVHPVPVADRLNALLTNDAPELQTLRQRVWVVGLALEAATPRCFERIGLALVRPKRLVLAYAGSALAPVEWEVSPQRLVHWSWAAASLVPPGGRTA